MVKYLCIILLILVGCRSKIPPIVDDFYNVIRDDVNKSSDLDGAIDIVNKHLKGIETAATQPTVADVQNDALQGAIDDLKAKYTDPASQTKIEQLQQRVDDLTRMIKEKANKETTPDGDGTDTGSEPEPDTEPDTGSEPEPEPDTEPDPDTEPEVVTIAKGSYLFLRWRQGTEVIEVMGDEKNSYDAHVAKLRIDDDDDDKPFSLVGYGGEVEIPKTVAIDFDGNLYHLILTAKILKLKEVIDRSIYYPDEQLLHLDDEKNAAAEEGDE